MGRVVQSVLRLTTGWTIRDRITVGTRFSTRPDRPWGPPSPLYNGYRVFPGGKVRPGRAADHSPLRVPRAWNSTAIPLPTLWATPGLKRDHFTFLLISVRGWVNSGTCRGRKDYVNEKFQWRHRESNPRPSGFYGSASTNCATACRKFCIKAYKVVYARNTGLHVVIYLGLTENQ